MAPNGMYEVWDPEFYTDAGQKHNAAILAKEIAAADAKHAKWAKQFDKDWAAAGDDVVDGVQAVGTVVAEAYGYGAAAVAVNVAIDTFQASSARDYALKTWGSDWLAALDAVATWVSSQESWDRFLTLCTGLQAGGIDLGKVQRIINRLYQVHPTLWDKYPGGPGVTGAAATGQLIGSFLELGADIADDELNGGGAYSGGTAAGADDTLPGAAGYKQGVSPLAAGGG